MCKKAEKGIGLTVGILYLNKGTSSFTSYLYILKQELFLINMLPDLIKTMRGKVR